MPRPAKPDFNEALAVPVGGGVSLRPAPGKPDLRRRPWRSVVTCRSAQTLLRFINSEFALPRGWQGAATRRDLLVGPGGTYEETRADSKEGSLAARCTSRSARPSNRSTHARAIAV